MKLLAAFSITILLFVKTTCCQILSRCTIEYEKVVNQYKHLEITDNAWGTEMKKQIPEFRYSYFSLTISDDSSWYIPVKTVNNSNNDWISGPAGQNIIFKNLSRNQITAAKQVFDELFLIKDSLPKYNWKLTGDTRLIAGFECRRATTIIMDSIFVVAFYSPEIGTSTGPESFNGLPGVILGIIVPRLFTHWFATKLEILNKAPGLFKPSSGKTVTTAELKEKIGKVFPSWGKWGQKFAWQTLL